MRKRTREKLLWRYSSALQRGDFDALAAVLAEAERDPALARQLAEIDAVYAAEPVPTFSSNGHRRENTMTVYVKTAVSPRRNFGGVLAAAAVLLVALIGAFAFASRPPADDDLYAGLPAQADATATALPTATPLPATIVPPAPGTTLLPALGSAALPILCTGQTNAEVVTELRSQPTLQRGIVVGYVPVSTMVVVVDTYQADTEGWYYVVAELDNQRVQGWVNANAITTASECAYNYTESGGLVQLTYIVQPGDTLLAIAARYGLDVADLPRLLELNNLTETSALEIGQSLTIEVPSNRPAQLMTITSTPIPVGGALDGDMAIMATATAIIIEATRQAGG
jgi:nucleoid-associated protein YgaU